MSTPDNNTGVSNAATNATRSTTGTKSSVNIQGIINSIRSIAKTKELEQKVEKLIQAQRATALPGLSGERIIAQQAVLDAGSSSPSSTVPRDEDKNPGSITDKAAETAADAAANAAADALKDGNNQPISDQSTDKSDLNTASDGETITSPDKGVYRIGDLFTDIAPYPSENGDTYAPRIKEIAGLIGDKEVSALLRELSQFDNIPTGWEDSDTPPIEPGWEDWEQGFWASAAGTYVSGSVYSHSRVSAAQAVFDTAVGFYHVGFDYTVTAYRNVVYTYNMDGKIGGGFVEYLLEWHSNPINTGWATGSFTVTGLVCGEGNPNEGDNCPIAAPRATEFPLGGILGFGWQDGKWNFHLYDSEGKKALEGGNSVLLMTDNGKGYELGPKRGGGWYAAPTFVMQGTTPAILIRPNGTVQGYIDKNVLPFYTGANTQTQNDNGFIGVPHLI